MQAWKLIGKKPVRRRCNHNRSHFKCDEISSVKEIMHVSGHSPVYFGDYSYYFNHILYPGSSANMARYERSVHDNSDIQSKFAFDIKKHGRYYDES